MMMRLLRLLAWFAFGVVLAFVGLVPARAETIAATAGPLAPTGRYQFLSNWYTSYHAAHSAALAYYAGAGATGYHVNPTGWSASPPAESVAWTGWNFGAWPYFTVRESPTQMGNGGSGWAYTITKEWWCSSGTLSWTGSAYTCQGGTGYSCPSGQNWTLSGQTCTRPDCVPPEFRNPATGSCQSCVAGLYVRPGGGFWSIRQGFSYLTGSGATVPATTCVDGCEVDLSDYGNGIQGYGGPDGKWQSYGDHKATGATCGGGSVVQPNTPEANCISQGKAFGTVNNTVVCVDQATTTKRQEVNATGPAGGTTKTVETQVCTGGSCNSTTTITHAGGGAAGGQTNGTTTSTTAASGSGKTGDGKTACETDPYGPACLGEPASGGGAGTESGGGPSAITPVSLPGSASCPAAVQVLQWEVPLTHACQLADYLRPIVLALAWLGAGVFVVGGLRNG